MSHRASCGGHPDPFTFLHPFPSKIAPAGSSGAGTISRGTKLGSMTSHTHTERERERERECLVLPLLPNNLVNPRRASFVLTEVGPEPFRMVSPTAVSFLVEPQSP
jgi:hypothetical protein